MNTANLKARYPIIPFDMNLKAPDWPWLIDGWWQRGKINIMVGDEKAGKSRLLRYSLIKLFQQQPLFGALEVTPFPKKTLWLAGEELPAEIIQKLLNVGAIEGIRPVDLNSQLSQHLGFVDASGFRLDTREYRDLVTELVVENKLDMLIIDPLRRVHGADENDNTQMSLILNTFREWTNRYGVTIVFLHHTPKSNDPLIPERLASFIRGAGDIASIVDCGLVVQRRLKGDPAKRKPGEIDIMRFGRFPEREILTVFDGNDLDYSFRPGKLITG